MPASGAGPVRAHILRIPPHVLAAVAAYEDSGWPGGDEMSRSRIRMVAVAGALSVALAASPIAAQDAASAETSPIKELMGENFGGLQTILYGLISANYGAVPQQADVIRRHAEEMQGMIPDSAKDEREKFLVYANNLAAHARDVKTISQALTEHDEARGESSTDYLREALASHYGGMVSMCVACHNRFRPLPIQ